MFFAFWVIQELVNSSALRQISRKYSIYPLHLSFFQYIICCALKHKNKEILKQKQIKNQNRKTISKVFTACMHYLMIECICDIKFLELSKWHWSEYNVTAVYTHSA